jgi:hypothetical protein
MIILTAIIQCDDPFCHSKENAQVRLEPGSQGIPILTIHEMPSDWVHYSINGSDGIHFCPKHDRYSSKNLSKLRR